jgi:hypothetical protein
MGPNAYGMGSWGVERKTRAGWIEVVRSVTRVSSALPGMGGWVERARIGAFSSAVSDTSMSLALGYVQPHIAGGGT